MFRKLRIRKNYNYNNNYTFNNLYQYNYFQNINRNYHKCLNSRCSNPYSLNKTKYNSSLTKYNPKTTVYSNKKNYKFYKNVWLYKNQNFNPYKILKTASTRLKANFLLNRSLKFISKAKRFRRTRNMKQFLQKTANNQKSSNKLCIFYTKFGRCRQNENCKNIHDQSTISICRRMFKGTCRKMSCPFSHNLSPDKMPDCTFFLRGLCNNESCRYRHIFLGSHANFCDKFYQGHCPQGVKCPNKHARDCLNFLKTGQCRLGDKCPFIHVYRNQQTLKKKIEDDKDVFEVIDLTSIDDDSHNNQSANKDKIFLTTKIWKKDQDVTSSSNDSHNSLCEVSIHSDSECDEESIYPNLD